MVMIMCAPVIVDSSIARELMVVFAPVLEMQIALDIGEVVVARVGVDRIEG